MGRRRKIFTQREFNKLSKTHEGRKKIITTYLALAIFFLIISLSVVIGSYFSGLLEFFRTFAFIGLAISLIVTLILVVCLKSENSEEQERVKKAAEQQKAKIEQQRLELEHQQKIAQLKAEEEYKRLCKLKNSNMDEVDRMTGYEFEEFVTAIMSDLGYNAITTQKSGDFGVDIILEKDEEKVIIQTKRYAKKVSLSAVQEITSAKQYFNIQTAWVVTNNYFTEPAINLAKANNVKLIDRDQLADLIIQAKDCSKEASLETINEIASASDDSCIKTALATDNHLAQPKTTHFTPSITDEINTYRDIVPQDNYDLWHVNQLKEIKNNILEIYPSYDINSIKEQIKLAENYEIKSKQNIISLYYFYSEIIGIVYALRYNNPEAETYCLELCDKDIKLLEQTGLSKISVPALCRKVIILEKSHKIGEAIQICDYATQHHYFDNGKPFTLRKERLLKKYEKRN